MFSLPESGETSRQPLEYKEEVRSPGVKGMPFTRLFYTYPALLTTLLGWVVLALPYREARYSMEAGGLPGLCPPSHVPL